MQNFSESKKGYSKEEVDAFLKKAIFDYEESLAEQKDRIFELVEKQRQLEEELGSYRRKDEEISKALVMSVQKAKEIEQAAQLRYDAEIQRLKLFHNKWVKYYRAISERYPMDGDLMSVENFLNEMSKILEENEDSAGVYPAAETVADREFIANRNTFRKTYDEEQARLKAVPVGNILGNNSSEKRFESLMQRHSSNEAATKVERAVGRMAQTSPGFEPIQRVGAYISSTVKAKPAVSDSGFDLNEVLNPGKKLDLGELCRELGFMDRESQ